MEEAQVKRLICVTGFGAGDSRGHGGFLYSVAFHLLLGRVYDDKDVQERIVRNSKLDWVIVRPVILTDVPKTNACRALVDLRRGSKYLGRNLLRHCTARERLSPGAVGLGRCRRARRTRAVDLSHALAGLGDLFCATHRVHRSSTWALAAGHPLSDRA